jgi:hypothetical protein
MKYCSSRLYVTYFAILLNRTKACELYCWPAICGPVLRLHLLLTLMQSYEWN